MVSDAATDGLSGIPTQPVYRALRCLFDTATEYMGDSGVVWYGGGVQSGSRASQSTSEAGLSRLLGGCRVRRGRRSALEIQKKFLSERFVGTPLA